MRRKTKMAKAKNLLGEAALLVPHLQPLTAVQAKAPRLRTRLEVRVVGVPLSEARVVHPEADMVALPGVKILSSG